jgi:hypothetical protein
MAMTTHHPHAPEHLSAPAGLLRGDVGSLRLAAEVPAALTIVAEMRASIPDLAGWVNFPLANGSGDAADATLTRHGGPARPTSHATSMPATAALVARLADDGFAVTHARIAVLGARDVLRAHIDMHLSIRLIVPLNDQGDDFRHIFGDIAVAMRAGELWSLDPSVCHGAANVARRGHRVALLVDADPAESDPPAWYRQSWSLPAERHLCRPAWSAAARTEVIRRASAAELALEGTESGPEQAEREWLLVPFEYDLGPEAAYDELVAACRLRAADADTPATADHWRARADHWMAHSCVCVA